MVKSIIIIFILAVPPALLAHPPGGGFVVPALPGAVVLPVQLVEGGPAARHVGLGRVGIQEKVSDCVLIEDYLLTYLITYLKITLRWRFQSLLTSTKRIK